MTEMAEQVARAPAARVERPEVFKNFVEGEWVESLAGRQFDNVNPADTGDIVG